MKKIIKLTESDLARIVRRVIQEQGPQLGVNPGLGQQQDKSDVQHRVDLLRTHKWGYPLEDFKTIQYVAPNQEMYNKVLAGVKSTYNKPTILSYVRSEEHGPISTPNEWAQKIVSFGLANKGIDTDRENFMKIQYYLQKFNKAEKWN